MPRLRFVDFRLSRAPRVLGQCADNYKSLSVYCNTAQERLLMAKEAGDEGWWGTWVEVAFGNISRTNPYITCPREIARLERIDVCDRPIQLQNQFYEYLTFGNGRLPKLCPASTRWSCVPEGYSRNSVVTFVDQSVFPCYIRAYATSASDIGAARRVLVQGLDQVDTPVRTQDGPVMVDGEFITLDTPFAQTTLTYNRITGFQKDITAGPVQIMQVDPTTGDELLLLTMQPTETVAGYRRYYLNGLPPNCCGTTVDGIQNLRVTAIAKLELIPAVVDTDYLLIQNLEAIIEECIAIRMSEMDNMKAQQLAQVHHVNAIRYLNSEITHYMGKQNPAIRFSPFGSARLERQSIGTML